MSDSNRDINDKLFKAVRKGDVDEVKRLISEGADVDALDGNKITPLWHAIVKGNKGMVSLLIDNKADVNAQSETGRALLHVAVGKANRTQPLDTSIIKALLEAEGINVNAVDKDGKTPLHEAAKSYDEKIVTVLLEAKGIYVTPLDNTSSTPFNKAGDI